MDGPLGLALSPNSDLLVLSQVHLSLSAATGFLFVACFIPRQVLLCGTQSPTSDVAGFGVDFFAGTLSSLPGSPFSGESMRCRMIWHHDRDNNVSVFRVNTNARLLRFVSVLCSSPSASFVAI